ncbi:MAG: DUF2799 domain-containing protein [Pseudomonadota bacterium]
MLAAPTLAAALVSACAQPPPPVRADACATADWRAVGVADGARGAGPERLAEHRASCAEAGRAPDARAWARGRQDGLRSYCTPANAHAVGASGQALAPYCPAARTKSLRRAHRLGLRRHRLEREIARIDSALLAPPPLLYGPYRRRYGRPFLFADPFYDDPWLWARRSEAEAALAALPPPPE